MSINFNSTHVEFQNVKLCDEKILMWIREGDQSMRADPNAHSIGSNAVLTGNICIPVLRMEASSLNQISYLQLPLSVQT